MIRGAAAGLAFAWIGFTLFLVARLVPAWGDLVPRWREVTVAGITLTGGLRAAGWHAVTLLAAVAFAVACAGAGDPLRRWFRVTRDRWPAVLLAGFIAIGTWHVALAWAGLFRPGILFAGLAAAMLFPGTRGWIGAAVRWRPPPFGVAPGWVAAFAGPILVSLVFALAPDAHVDTYTYHLGLPAQWLLAGKFSDTGITIPHGFPLLAESCFAVGVALDLDALPHLMQIVPFGAGVAVAIRWAAVRGGTGAGWLAAAGLLGWGETLRLLPVAKCDLVAAGFALAGFAWLSAGRGVAAALVLGGAAAAKPSGMALGALGLIAAVIMRRRPVRFAAVAGMFVLPWLARSWLMMGDPLWPLLSRWWPGALMDPESAASARAALRGTGLGAGIAFEFAAAFAANAPAAALVVIPALLGLGSRVNRPAGALRLAGLGSAGVAGLAALAPAEWVRIALPCWGALIVAAAPAVAGFAVGTRPALRRMSLVLGVAGAWLALRPALGDSISPGAVPWLIGIDDPTSHRHRRLSTWSAAADRLAVEPGRGRVLVIGEVRAYRLPARVPGERCFGRTLPWVLARSSATAARSAVRLRQSGATHLLYNFVTESYPHAHAAPFTWDDRMIAVWRETVGRSLDLAWVSAVVDYDNGGFAMYRLRTQPRLTPPDALPYLPGIEGLAYRVTRHGITGDMDSYLREARALADRVPRVYWVDTLLATGLYSIGDFRGGYDRYRPGIRAGHVDYINWLAFALCARRVGAWEESMTAFDRAETIYPWQAKVARAGRGRMLVDRGRAALNTPDRKGATRWLAAGIGILERILDPDDREDRAELAAARADLERARGDRGPLLRLGRK